MTILILNWRDIKHPLGGGAEISLFEHAKYWQRKGAKVIWFASYFENALAEEVIDNIKIIRGGSHFTVYFHAYTHYICFLKNKVDIILDNFHFLPFFTPFYINTKKILAFINEPAKAAWFKNINVFIALMGYLFEPLFFLPYRKVIFLTGSKSIASELPFYGIKKESIRIVPHGVSVDKTLKLKRSGIPTLLYLAQLSPDKGIKDAIEMFILVKKVVPNIRLLVAGKPVNKAYGEKMITFARRLKISDSELVFLGFIPEIKKYCLIQEAWMLIHPSIREGWGLTVIEAAAFGTPAVGYNVAGLSDSIQHMQTGLLTKINSPESLAESVILLIKDKKLYDKLSQNAFRFAKNFSWEKSGKLSFSIIKGVYEKNKE